MNFSLLLNVRLNVVMLIGFIAFIMLADSADRSFGAWLAIKTIGVALVYVDWHLAKYWNVKGFFGDIEEE